MKRLVLALGFALVHVPAFAGVDISWNDCVNGTAGTAATNKVFDCTGTQNRNYDLEIQYKTPVDFSVFEVTAYLDIGSFGAPLSPFWHYETGGCNHLDASRAGAQLMATIPESCRDAGYLETWHNGTGVYAAIISYSADFPAPGHGRFVLHAVGLSGGFPVAAGDNMWAFRLRFNNRNRPCSAANCAGCSEQKILILERIRLESDDGSPPLDLTGADKYTQCVSINNAPVACETPIQNLTWGKIKSLFR